MNHSEAGRLSRSSQLQAQIDAFCSPYRPKLLRQYEENGKMVNVYQEAWAQGSNEVQWIKSTVRNGIEL